MATRNYCGHLPRHIGIISRYDFNVFNGEITDNPRGYIIVNNTLYIICLINYIQRCPRCHILFYVYIYGTKPNVLASFDGKTNLPIIATVPRIVYNIKPRLYELPGFGTFLYSKKNSSGGNLDEYILFCSAGELKKQHERTELLMCNDKCLMCFINTENNYVFINLDGELMDAIVIRSDPEYGNSFKIGNGYLEYTRPAYEIMLWTYSHGPALRTKAAIASATIIKDDDK